MKSLNMKEETVLPRFLDVAYIKSNMPPKTGAEQ